MLISQNIHQEIHLPVIESRRKNNCGRNEIFMMHKKLPCVAAVPGEKLNGNENLLFIHSPFFVTDTALKSKSKIGNNIRIRICFVKCFSPPLKILVRFHGSTFLVVPK